MEGCTSLVLVGQGAGTIVLRHDRRSYGPCLWSTVHLFSTAHLLTSGHLLSTVVHLFSRAHLMSTGSLLSTVQRCKDSLFWRRGDDLGPWTQPQLTDPPSHIGKAFLGKNKNYERGRKFQAAQPFFLASHPPPSQLVFATVSHGLEVTPPPPPPHHHIYLVDKCGGVGPTYMAQKKQWPRCAASSEPCIRGEGIICECGANNSLWGDWCMVCPRCAPFWAITQLSPPKRPLTTRSRIAAWAPRKQPANGHQVLAVFPYVTGLCTARTFGTTSPGNSPSLPTHDQSPTGRHQQQDTAPPLHGITRAHFLIQLSSQGANTQKGGSRGSHGRHNPLPHTGGNQWLSRPALSCLPRGHAVGIRRLLNGLSGKMKTIKGALNVRPILGAQTFFFGL